MCFVRRRRPCVRSSVPRRISALDSPSIRGTRNQNSKARTRFSWPGWACGTDLTTSRDFLRDTKYPFQPQLIWQAKPPKSNQTRKQCYRGAVRGCVSAHHPNGCIVTVPPGSSRDLTAVCAHPGVPCRSSHCFPAPGWTGARRGGEPLDSRESGESCPSLFSGASFPMVSHPPPPPYYAVAILRVLPREGDERLAIFPNIKV